ncbi:MAG: UvrD-helicase domain-containing protein, partial [Thermoanaerobaculia bacterium]
MTQAPLLFAPRRRNLFDEAGAGTGKTTEIVRQELENLLDHPRLSPERLVLITFTEKAAGEIAERIRDGLVDMHAALVSGGAGWPSGSVSPILAIPPDRRTDWTHACETHLAQLDRIRSQTIHSFCQSILARHPLEAGLDPSFRIAEGFERSRLLEEIWLEWLEDETTGEVEPARAMEWEHAIEGLGDVRNLRKVVLALVQHRGLLSLGLGGISSFRDVAAPMRAAVGEIRALPEIDVAVDHPDTAAFLAYVRAVPPPAGDEASAWVAWLEPVANRLRDAYLTGLTTRVKTPLRVLRGEKKDQNLYDLLVAERTASAALRLGGRFLDRLEAEKDRRGVLDFDDLLIRTERLLKDPSVAAEVRARIDWLFVDEFQDTDWIQASIVRRLATGRSGEVEEGRIVLVGDPKQSIYSFRGADPETYGETLDFFVKQGAERRVLRHQYRSRPALVHALNVMFARLFEAQGDVNVFRPHYEPLEPGLAGGGDNSPPVRFVALRHLPNENVDDEPGSSGRQAAAVAAMIRARIDAGVPAESFAILVRKMTTIDAYLDALDAAGIEYVLPRNRSIFERRAAIDLLAVLRAIAAPFDRGAAFSAARSPYFALTDDEITAAFLLKEAGGAPDPGSPHERFRLQIKRWTEYAGWMSVEQLAGAIIAESGVDVLYRLQARGESHLDDLEALLELAREFDRAVGASLPVFVEEMLRRREGGESSEPAIIDDNAGGVRVLTVHASKGLEFGRVIFPELACAMPGDSLSVFRLSEPERLYLKGSLTTIGTRAEKAEGGKTPAAVLKERNEAENDRLFYVAVTRAREEVVFVLDPLTTSKQTFMKPLLGIFGFDVKALGALFPAEPGERRETLKIGDESLEAAFESLEPLPVPEEALPRLVSRELGERARRELPPPEPDAPPAPVDRTELVRRAEKLRYRRAGLLLHRFLEIWDGAPEIGALLEMARLELGATELERDRVARRIEAILASSSHERIRGLETVGRETTIWLEEEGKLREARIDRLLRDGQTWVVLDYKSGRASEDRLEADREQVTRYCRAIAAMSGEPCRGLVWYIDLDGEEIVEIKPEARSQKSEEK